MMGQASYFEQAEDRIERLECQLELMRREKKSLKAEILRLLGEVRSWQAEFGAMVKIRDGFVAELEEATAERKELQGKNGDLATKLRNAFTLRERLEAELEEAFEMLQAIRDQLKGENTR